MTDEECVAHLFDCLLADELRERTAAGEFIRHILSAPLVSAYWIREYAKTHRIRSKNCHHPRSVRRMAIAAVVDDGLSVRAAAIAVGISKSTVQRVVMEYRDREAAEEDEVGYRRVKWRCPTHGLINVKPCPACLAIGQR